MTTGPHETSAARSTARARSIVILTQYAESIGITAEQALAGTCLDTVTLHHPDAEATRADEVRAIANIVAAGAPATAGLEVGMRYHLTTFGIWGFAVMSSPNVGAGAEVAMRFVDLIAVLTSPTYEVDATSLTLVAHDPPEPPDVARFIVQRDVTLAQSMLRDLIGPDAAFSEVAFTFTPDPADRDAYTAAFRREPVFGAARNVLVMDADLMSAELPQADPVTLARALDQCHQHLDQLKARVGTAGQVRDAILGNIQRPPSTAEIAALLHLSERTLRRRLAEEGTSLRALNDEVRSTLAAEFLRSGSLTVAEISDRLGYVEQSSFSQAFRRWYGMSPRAFAAARR